MTRALPTVDIGGTTSRVPYDAIVTFEVGDGRLVQVWQDPHGEVHFAAVTTRGGALRISPVSDNEASATCAS